MRERGLCDHCLRGTVNAVLVSICLFKCNQPVLVLSFPLDDSSVKTELTSVG